MRTSIDRGTASTTGAKLRMLVIPARDEAVGGVLRGGGGRGDDADAHPLGLHDLGQLVDVADAHAAEHGADLGLVDVDDAGDREAALAEPAVAGEGLAEVAGADDDDRPVVGQAELAADLVHEVGDLVADPAGAVAAEVGEVLADLGGVDPAELGQAVRRDAVDAVVGLLAEDPQVDRQAGDGGLGDAAAGSFGGHNGAHVRHSCTRSQSGTGRSHVTRHDRLCVGAARRSSTTAMAVATARACAGERRAGRRGDAGRLAFALSTLDRWRAGGGPHELAWTISLALFAIGAGALWWAESRGWSLASFRVFFVAGAVLNVPWLALGTVYLLAGEAGGNRVRAWLIGLSGLSVGIVLFAPTAAGRGHELPTGKDVFGVAPRSSPGSARAWPPWSSSSARCGAPCRLVRHRAAGAAARGAAQPAPRPAGRGNVLIAVGTLVLSASGTLAGRLGKDRAFAVTLLVGIVVLFAGFLVASAPARAPRCRVPQRRPRCGRPAVAYTSASGAACR